MACVMLTLWLEVTVQNSLTGFWTVTFSIYGSVCLEFFGTVTFETIIEKKQPSIFRKHEIRTAYGETDA